MAWQVEGADDLASWFLGRSNDEQVDELLGGDKTGNSRWYDENVPLADDRYDEYIREIEKEGL